MGKGRYDERNVVSGIIPIRNIQHLVLGYILVLVFLALNASAEDDQVVVNATSLNKFVDEIPVVPNLPGYQIVNGKPCSAHLKIGMFYKKWKFHRDLPPTPVFAYGTSKQSASIPGPVIESLKGVSTYVTWENHLPWKHILPWDRTIPVATPTKGSGGVPTVVHLHGGIHGSEYDGHSRAWFTSGFGDKGPEWSTKIYIYPNNQQPGNLFYHDHTMGLTRVNLLAGLFGPYIIRQPDVEDPLGLPSGRELDRTLMIFDKSFYKNGSIYMDPVGNNPSIHPQWQPEYFGDVVIVNGKAWPKMTVRRRNYRFRIINSCNARFLRLHLSNGLDFILVGSDSVYLDRPIRSKNFLLGPSEIADVIIDFSESNSDSTIMLNDAPYPYPSGDAVNSNNGNVMKFIIRKFNKMDGGGSSSNIPARLLEYRSPDLSAVAQTRYISLFEYASSIDEPTHLFINGLSFEDPVTETPKVGTNEVWYVINLTEDNHPVHIHLGLFKVLDQTELLNVDEFRTCMKQQNNTKTCHLDHHARGKHVPVPAYERGWKNVFKMMPGYVTKLYVTFAYIHTSNSSTSSYSFDATTGPGYAYHCHILDHEDNVMMRPLKLLK